MVDQVLTHQRNIIYQDRQRKQRSNQIQYMSIYQFNPQLGHNGHKQLSNCWQFNASNNLMATTGTLLSLKKLSSTSTALIAIRGCSFWRCLGVVGVEALKDLEDSQIPLDSQIFTVSSCFIHVCHVIHRFSIASKDRSPIRPFLEAPRFPASSQLQAVSRLFEELGVPAVKRPYPFDLSATSTSIRYYWSLKRT